ncbi:MAG: asparagine synthase (glutamine-hydrolyzing) [Polyangiales bacterium]
MCGIVGVVNLAPNLPPPDRALVARMVAALRHRGPDEFGVYLDDRAALGHARLSIVDLAAGQQPMATADGALTVAFNGEIFNHVELREELTAAGHAFRTRSDTEVILHAWRAWGEGCLDRFNGQWAFALWDNRSGELTLARDRLGVRPIHLHEGGGRVRFASEAKALFADPDVPRALDPAGLAETFTFWATRAPRTPFANVTELPPGSLRVWGRDGSSRERRWWRPRFPTSRPAPRDEGEAVEALRDVLRAATRLRMMRADVPVGAYVSGGVDSAVAAAFAREAVGGALHTFSLRFEDAEFDETPHQRAVVEALGSTHHELIASRSDIARALPAVVRHAERPLVRTGPAPLFLLSSLVRDAGMKVVVTGEGADEVLGGYDIFREAAVRRFWARRPQSTLRPRLFDRLYPWLARSPQAARGVALGFWARGLDAPDAPFFSHLPRWNTARSLQRFLLPDVAAAASVAGDPLDALAAALPEDFPRWHPLARAQHLEMETLLAPYILSSQGDRVLMAHSIEGRFPFLDADVIAFAEALPASAKLLGLDEKHLLKRAARGLVPESITRRAKQPYRSPDAACFVGPGAPEYVRDALSPERVRAVGAFEPALVSGLAAKCERLVAAGNLSNADNMAFVGVLTTQLLHDEVLRAPPPDGDAVPFTTVIDRRSAA